MARVFVASEHWPDIIGTDVHYLRDVLRLEPNDKLELLDGSGLIHAATITAITPERVSCRVTGSRPAESEPAAKITLAQALPKAAKMDFIVEKCTELGVTRVIPMLTARTIAQGVKLERWRKLAKEAAEQSGRAIIPEISDALKFAEVIKLKDKYDLALIPWEQEKENTLKQSLRSLPLPRFPQILVAIGPEGGFTDDEVESARNAGLVPVSLGKRILRTETAGLAALANMIYEFG